MQLGTLLLRVSHFRIDQIVDSAVVSLAEVSLTQTPGHLYEDSQGSSVQGTEGSRHGREHQQYDIFFPQSTDGLTSSAQSSSSYSAASTRSPFATDLSAIRSTSLRPEPFNTLDFSPVPDYLYSHQSDFEKAADNMLKTTGVLFQVYNLEQQNSILKNVYGRLVRPLSKAAVCELCALAAIGAQ